MGLFGRKKDRKPDAASAPGGPTAEPEPEPSAEPAATAVITAAALGNVWCWTKSGSSIVLSEDGGVASFPSDSSPAKLKLVTGGALMTEGRHYWEVETGGGSDYRNPLVVIGAVRPDVDHENCYCNAQGNFFIHPSGGLLYGNGKTAEDEQEGVEFKRGDRIGVLLDLEAGWLRFYHNGEQCGPGFTEGVTGPLVRAAMMQTGGDKVTALPPVAEPEGAGGL
jgi:hypothetical protein